MRCSRARHFFGPINCATFSDTSVRWRLPVAATNSARHSLELKHSAARPVTPLQEMEAYGGELLTCERNCRTYMQANWPLPSCGLNCPKADMCHASCGWKRKKLPKLHPTKR